MAVGEGYRGEFTEHVSLTLLIEDVTQEQRDEFMRLLSIGGQEITITLADGLDYVAVVQ